MKNKFFANVWLKSPDHKSYLEITFIMIETFIRNSLNMCNKYNTRNNDFD